MAIPARNRNWGFNMTTKSKIVTGFLKRTAQLERDWDAIVADLNKTAMVKADYATIESELFGIAESFKNEAQEL